MEKIESVQPPKTQSEAPRLYPERTSIGIEEKLQLLSDLEAGRVEKLIISEQDREILTDFENTLGAALEKIFAITPKEFVFYTEYLLSPSGRADFEQSVGISLPDDIITMDAAELFLYSATKNIAAMKAKERVAFAGRARDYSEDRLLQELLKEPEDSGTLALKQTSPPGRVSLLLTPEENRKKITSLRTFKGLIKRYQETLGKTVPDKSPAFKEILSGILDLYQSRVNLMIASSSSDAFIVEKKLASAGEKSLSSDEATLRNEAVGFSNIPRGLSRYDKFTHGASEYRDGWRQQAGEELRRFADEVEAIYINSTVLRNEAITKKGLNPEKVSDPNRFSPDVLDELARETLASYGLLSEIPASEYSSDRPGPAEDNKWQFVMSEEFKTMAVDSKRKVIKCGPKSQSAATAISITLAHEIEGHVIQHENKSRIPLRLFQKLGSGRTDVFAECGAMYNQDLVSKNAFGYDSPSHPHYLRAMEKKLQGGNYLECVQAFYQSAMKAPLLKKTLGKTTNTEFQKEARANLKLAINRARRLFNSGEDLSTSSRFLTNSKDTAYLEQIKLFRELSEHGAEKYAFILGANLDTLIFLIKSGFLNPADIKKPQYHALEIWERMKDEYVA